MGDVAQGIKAFKKGMSDDEVAAKPDAPKDPKIIDNQPAQNVGAESRKVS
jgi:sec-independent protein translocase protein TatA